MHRLDHTAERFVANHHRPVHLDVLAHGVDGVPPPLAHEAERSSGLSERPRLTPRWRGAEALAETPAIRVVAQCVSNDPLDDLVGKFRQPGRTTCVPGTLVVCARARAFSLTSVRGLRRGSERDAAEGARQGGLAREFRRVAHRDRAPDTAVPGTGEVGITREFLLALSCQPCFAR